MSVLKNDLAPGETLGALPNLAGGEEGGVEGSPRIACQDGHVPRRYGELTLNTFRWNGAATAGVATLMAVCVGAAVTKPTLALATAAATAALLAWVAFPRLAPGFFVGISILAALNGLPGIDFEDLASRGSFRPQDLFIVGVLTFAALSNRRSDYKGAPQWVFTWSAILAAWWSFTVLRTWMFEAVPLLQAALYGRDFLYLALVTPALYGFLRTRMRVIGVAVPLVAGAVLFAVGTIGVAGFGVELPLLVHAKQLGNTGGSTRIYAEMNDLLNVGVTLSVALALLGKGGARLTGCVLLMLFVPAFFLEFTRALYFGFGLALVIAALLSSGAGTSSSASRFRRGLGVALVSAVLLTPVTVNVVGAGPAAGNAVVERLSSGVAEFAAGGGTVGYRQQLAGQLLRRLGQAWPVGLGFLHPSARFESGFPEGSIRNPDVGALNALMTFGLIGVALIFFPVVSVLGRLIRSYRAAAETSSAIEWVGAGVTLWLLTALLTASTLVTLFSPSGLTVTALMLATGLRFTEAEPRGATQELPGGHEPALIGRTESP